MADSKKVTVRGVALALVLCCASLAAVFATPKLVENSHAVDLNETLPSKLKDWASIPSPLLQVSLTTGEGTSMGQPYDQSVMRSYVNTDRRVMYVAVAWGKSQRQEIKIHRPELCYPAQGFAVQSLTDAEFPIISPVSGQKVIGKRMVAKEKHGGQYEVVSYWIRIGDLYSDSAFETRVHILKEGLAGRVPDGVLVRVSERVNDLTDLKSIYQRQDEFLSQLVASSDPATRKLLLH